MIPTRAERGGAARRRSHSHSFCSAFGFLTVANIKVEVGVWHVTFEGGLRPCVSKIQSCLRRGHWNQEADSGRLY